MKSEMTNEWYLTDDDCYQWMKHCTNEPDDYDDYYDMLQVVWLDTTPQEKANGLHEYCVVGDRLYISSLTPNDIDCALAAYGYSMTTYDPIRIKCGDYEMTEKEAWGMIAECYLEDELLRDSCVAFKSDSYDDCCRFIEKYIAEH